jgi:hypothetical protein
VKEDGELLEQLNQCRMKADAYLVIVEPFIVFMVF